LSGQSGEKIYPHPSAGETFPYAILIKVRFGKTFKSERIKEAAKCKRKIKKINIKKAAKTSLQTYARVQSWKGGEKSYSGGMK